MSEELPSAWKKAQVISGITASVLIPVVLGLVGFSINKSIEEKELALNYVQIAVGLLKDKSSPETSNLRTWAVNTLNHYSHVKMSKEVQMNLIENQLKIVTTPSPAAQRLSADAVKRIISRQFSMPEENLKNDARLIEDLGADDLDLVELMMALEDASQRVFSDEEFEKLKTVGDVVKKMATLN